MPKIITMKRSEYDKMCAAELREKYMIEAPEGLSKSDIKSMSDNDILDMDYFLHELEYDLYDNDNSNDKEPDVIYSIIDDSPNYFDDDDFVF